MNNNVFGSPATTMMVVWRMTPSLFDQRRQRPSAASAAQGSLKQDSDRDRRRGQVGNRQAADAPDDCVESPQSWGRESRESNPHTCLPLSSVMRSTTSLLSAASASISGFSGPASRQFSTGSPRSRLVLQEFRRGVGNREAAEAAEHAEAADEQQLVCRDGDNDDGGLAHGLHAL